MLSKEKIGNNKCLLCLTEDATQKNSHLIPKFFSKGLFWGTSPQQSIAISKDGIRKIVQGIPKEDYLFCPECERKFNLLETYCALRFGRYEEIRYAKDFSTRNVDGITFFETKNLDIRVFNLFVYSIIWRISISNRYEYMGMKLSDSEEVKLRIILSNHITTPLNELLNSVGNINELPIHSHALLRPKKILRPPRSMLSASSYNEVLHQVHLVDYVLLYATKSGILNRLSIIDNNRLSGLVRIGIVENSDWESFNKKMIQDVTSRF